MSLLGIRAGVGTLRPEMTRRMRWLALLMVPLIVLAVVSHSAVLTPLIHIVLVVLAVWVLGARRR